MRVNLRMTHWMSLGCVAALAACSETGTGPSGPGSSGGSSSTSGGTVSGVVVEVPPLTVSQQQELSLLQAQRAQADALSTAEFLDQFDVPFISTLPYDPLQAEFLSTIQSSAYAIDSTELQKLGQDGFVISKNRTFPSFAYGMAAFYEQDLPIYISADSILNAVHRSVDDLLKSAEQHSLIAHLHGMLTDMRTHLAAGAANSAGDDAVRDVDLYLAVGLSLLDGTVAQPVAGASSERVQEIVGMVMAEELVMLDIFDEPDRKYDFSQAHPRGHYTDTPELGRYFRSMMWLGRTEFRFIHRDEASDKMIFHRRQVMGAMALGLLLTGGAQAHYQALDGVISRWVGDADNLTADRLPNLLTDLGVADVAGLADKSDQEIANAITAGGYGVQRIRSQVLQNLVEGTELKPAASFLLLGQRYVVDAHVLSNVVHDIVPERWMPSTMDVAFGALANDQAAALLSDMGELDAYGYSKDLHFNRILVDGYDPAFWQSSLYNAWMSALRALSPKATTGLPSVMSTEPWGRRVLNTQLASWSELRHDTILYAKQSYTGGGGCDYPDAYVDPYPDFYAALSGLAERGLSALSVIANEPGNNGFVQGGVNYFSNLRNVANLLGDMANRELTGQPLTADQVTFVRDAVYISQCSGSPLNGWYARLFYSPWTSIESDPTVADVHTQPYLGDVLVGRVLHAGTGKVRMMVVTVENCQGPRAYAGLVSSYHEEITEDFQRLTDEEWSVRIWSASPPADVPWMIPLVGE